MTIIFTEMAQLGSGCKERNIKQSDLNPKILSAGMLKKLYGCKQTTLKKEG